MPSEVILLICLLIGFGIGLFARFNVVGAVQKLLNLVIIVLIFIMGAALGMKPDLPANLIKYGYNAFVITALALFCSALTVFLIVKLTKRNKDK